MQMTSPKLADHSQTLFETRDLTRASGSKRPSGDRSAGGFSSVLDDLRDKQRGTTHFQKAQESSESAQALPNRQKNGDDDEEVENTVQGEDAEKVGDQKAASEADDHGEADEASDESGGDEESTGAVGGQQQSGEVNASEVGTAIDDESSDEEGEDGDKAEKTRAGHRGRADDGAAGRGDAGQSKGSVKKLDSAATETNQRDASPRASARSTDQHHLHADNNRESAVQGPRMTDEAAPPLHLQSPKADGQERAAEQREPVMFDQDEHRDRRIMPAVSRVQQVESQVRLENATGQSGATDAATRLAAVSTGGSNGSSLNGEQNGQNLPSQTGSGADRATPDDARFSGRVVRGLTAMINSRGGTMMMRLDPPELGQLRVQMTLARGTVSASFVAQTNQARVLLEKNMTALRTALETQGLTVERLSVQTSPSSNQQGHLMNDENTQRQQEQQRQDAAGGESRGKRDEQDGQPGARGSGDFADVIQQLEETQDSRH